MRGSELAERNKDGKTAAPHVDLRAMFGGAALFLAPALLGKPSLAAHMARLGPVGGPMLSGAALVTAALATNEYLHFLKLQDGKYLSREENRL